MKNSNSRTTVTPQIEYLTDILDNVTQGILRVPNFQRPFVWKPDDMIALFESIYSGYPIGSLLFWEADKNYNTLSHIGPYKLKENISLPINYILDGHQRLSTLYGVLTNIGNSQEVERSDDYRWLIYYDLLNDNFLHVKGKEIREPHYFPLNKLLKTTDFLKETSKLLSRFPNNGEELIEKAEKLLKIFRGYRIAITQIVGGGLESAVHIFSRLNTKGVQMSIDRMYSALTYREGEESFNLSARIDEIKTKLSKYNFHDVDRMIIFRSILAAAGKDLYTKGKFDLFKETDNIPEIVSSCEESLLKAVSFLTEKIKVPSKNFLPHSLQLIILSEFFRLAKEPSKEKQNILEKWFWVTSYIGIDIVNSSKKRQTLNEIRDFAKIDDRLAIDFEFNTVDFDGMATAFPSRFDLNSSRVRAFSIFLSSLNPISFSDYKPYKTKSLLSKYGYRAFNQVSRVYNDKEKLASNPANRVISSPNDKGQILKYIKEISSNNLFAQNINKEEILESHGIPPFAAQALLSGDVKLFIEERMNYLIKKEKQFIIEKGLNPYETNITSEVFPDTD